RAGDAARALGRLEVAAELILEDAVNPLHLLLFAQLQAIAGELRFPRLPVLSRRKVALLDGALFRVTPLSLEKQFHRLAAAQAADRTNITSHQSPFILDPGGFAPADPPRLHASPLRRPASLVRDRRHVADRLHFQTARLPRTDGRLAAGAGALHAHVERSHPHRLGRVAGIERGLRRGERRPLARSLEADAAGARPRHA